MGLEKLVAVKFTDNIGVILLLIPLPKAATPVS